MDSGQPKQMEALEQQVVALAGASRRWSSTSPQRKVELLEATLRSYGEVMQAWVDQSVAAKGGLPIETVCAEEWLSGPLCVLRNLRLLARSLRELAEGGKPGSPAPPCRSKLGRTLVQVLPSDLPDRLAFPGFTADVWFEPGVSPEDVPRLQAGHYADGGQAGVSLVLGAGNVSSIAPGDVLYKLFVENQSVVLKPNPVLGYLTPLLTQAFQPLIDEGVLALVEGGREVGEQLCVLPEITDVHVTGALRTHLSVLEVIRSGGRQARLTSELGNVSPVIVVPGPWTDAELDFHAQSIVTMLVNNAGFNCNAARVLVLPDGWPGTNRLLDMLRFHLAAVPTRPAYYPGAGGRFDLFLDAHPEALCFGDCSEGHLPWALIPGLDPNRTSDICFTTESFCGILGATRLPFPSPEDYLRAAVRFANEVLWGTLNATVLIHPETAALPAVDEQLESAIAGLRYGTVSINHWPGIDFGMMSTPWGGFPGGTPDDPQSGLGFVHNTLMFGGIEKAVVESPFYSEQIPPWFVTAEGSHRMLSRLAKMLLTMV